MLGQREGDARKADFELSYNGKSPKYFLPLHGFEFTLYWE